LRLPEKQSCPENFHCIEIFLLFRIFGQLALALKTEFALTFFKPGGRPSPPPRTPMLLTAFEHRQKETRSLFAAQYFYRSCL